MSLLSIATNISEWFQVWYHIVSFVLIFCAIGILVVRQYLIKKKGDSYSMKLDITLKASALLVMLIASIVAVI